MTLHDLLNSVPASVSRRDAETLALHVLGQHRAWMHTHPEASLSDVQSAAMGQLFARRARSEPLQYITGHREFFGLDLLVTPAVLIPRPETEHVVEEVLGWSVGQPRDLQLLDVGTGSGAIALALAVHLPSAQLTALDISSAALEVAQRNADRLGLVDRVRFLESDLLNALHAELASGLRFDAIVSNPPYVPTADAPDLAAEVRDYEPPVALFAGRDGMEVYRRLIPAAAQALRPGGLLVMEFGYGQRDLMNELFQTQPAKVWSEWSFVPDLQGIPRVVKALHGEGEFPL